MRYAEGWSFCRLFDDVDLCFGEAGEPAPHRARLWCWVCRQALSFRAHAPEEILAFLPGKGLVEEKLLKLDSGKKVPTHLAFSILLSVRGCSCCRGLSCDGPHRETPTLCARL